jgi:hypothetical protein
MLQLQLTEVLRKNLRFPETSNIQQRGIADKIEAACNDIIKENFLNVKEASSRRSIEDITINDTFIDHKTSDLSLKFKMPNMISIDRLKKLNKELIYNFVIYNSSKKEIINTFTLNVYELNWDHLSIQNLGKGQLQITSMVNFLKSPKTNLSKEEWINKLQQEAILFYKKVQRDSEKRQKEWQNWKH